MGALFVRIYRTEVILSFYFDQGRDAKVVYDLWHNGKFFLLGPTTGIAGIFRGPFYYYLVTPLYLLSQGDPVFPANFLGASTVVAIILMYAFAAAVFDRKTGLIASFIASFSFYLIFASRWLSNPTPMFLLSISLVWALYGVIKGYRWAWVLVSFIAGTSLFHFGSSGEFFYFPAIAMIALWQRKHFPTFIILVISIVVFLLTALPLILFDWRHDGILHKNIGGFLGGEDTFKTNFWDVLRARFEFYYSTAWSKLYPGLTPVREALVALVGISFVMLLPRLWKNDGFKLLIILLLSPIFGLLFFQGNFGNIYDYYLTGYYLIFILVFSIVLREVWRFLPGKFIVGAFLIVFMLSNTELISARLRDNADGPETILFGNQKQALDWIYADAGNTEFNTDVYVPPVIPHAYDYLFLWYGEGRGNKVDKHVERLYTLYEVDPPHPERLEAWIRRQATIGEIEEETRFGGITGQRRERL